MPVNIFCNIGNTLPKDAVPTENAKSYGCNACEYIQMNEVNRCNKFIAIAGKTPDGDDVDEWRCSDAWEPVLILENAMTNRGQTEALTDTRDRLLQVLNVRNQISAIAVDAATSPQLEDK